MDSKSLKKSTKKRKKELSHSDSSQPKSKKQRIDDDQLICNKMKEVAVNEKKSDAKSKKKITDDDQLSTFKMKEKKGNDLPGQKHDTPGERDPLRIFFEALYQQLPDNEIAAVWMMEWGLLSPDEAIKIYKKVSSPVKEIAANKSSDVAANQMNETVTANMPKAKKRKVKLHKLDNQSRLIAPVKRKKHKASS